MPPSPLPNRRHQRTKRSNRVSPDVAAASGALDAAMSKVIGKSTRELTRKHYRYDQLRFLRFLLKDLEKDYGENENLWSLTAERVLDNPSTLAEFIDSKMPNHVVAFLIYLCDPNLGGCMPPSALSAESAISKPLTNVGGRFCGDWCDEGDGKVGGNATYSSVVRECAK
ncbi:hypothetical protein HDU93_006590, partial [Gonapodya sp. JEL0774]